MNATTARAGSTTARATNTPTALDATDGPRRSARIARPPAATLSAPATPRLQQTVLSSSTTRRQHVHGIATLPVKNAPSPRTPSSAAHILGKWLSALSARPKPSPHRLAIMALALLGAIAIAARLSSSLQTRSSSNPTNTTSISGPSESSAAPHAALMSSTPSATVAEPAQAEPASPSVNPPTPTVIDVASTDARMNAAIVRARQTLATFWQHAGAPGIGENEFSLKIALPTQAGSLEHIWSKFETRNGEQVVVSLTNEPVDVADLGIGSAVTVTSSQISDWMFRRNGKIVGAETLRVLIDTLPAAQGAKYRAMLETN